MHRVANHSAWLFLMVPNSAWSCLMLPDRAMDNKAQPGTTKHHEAQSPGGSWETGPRARVAVAPRPGGRQLGFPVLSAIVLAVALLWSLLAAPIARADPIADDIANELACQCGCGYTVASCGGAMQCDVGDQMAVLVSQKVKKGETKEEILTYFVNQYGEKVLAAPTKEGFNLTAWITPFLAVGAGGTVVYFVLREWLANRRIREETEPPAPADLGGYGERIDRELEQFG